MIRRLTINILISVIALLIGISLLEAYARIFLKINYFTTEEVAPCYNEGIKIEFIIPDDKLGFLPGPLWRGEEGRYGFQNGKEYENLQGEQKNIVIIGDSIIQDRDLERSFKFFLKNKPYKIWNAGIGGYNTLQEAIYLKEHIKITPDVLILGFCLNDFVPSMSILSSAFKKMKMAQNFFEPLGYVNPFLFKHSSLYRFLKLRKIFLAAEGKIWSRENVFNNKKIVKSGLEMMQEYCLQHKIPFIVVIFPHLLKDYSNSWDAWVDQAYLSILPILDEMNIKYIDIHEVYNGLDIEKLKRRANDIVHPNLKGQFIVAKEVINRFFSDFGLTRQSAAEIALISFSQFEEKQTHN